MLSSHIGYRLSTRSIDYCQSSIATLSIVVPAIGLLDMLAAYQGVVKFIAAQKAVLGEHHAIIRQTQEGQVRHLVSVIRTAERDLEDGTSLLHALGTDDSGAFSEEQRVHLSVVVSEAHMVDVMPTLPKAGAMGKKPQTHRFTYNYYTEESWSVFCDQTVSLKTKYQRVSADWLYTFGIRVPSEPTYRIGLATVCVASTMQVSGRQAYDMLQEFKNEFRIKRDHHIGGAATLLTFPSQPIEYRNLFPTAYDADMLPVPCRVDVNAIVQMAHPKCLACRSSNNIIRVPSSGLARSSTGGENRGNSHNQLLIDMMQYVMGKDCDAGRCLDGRSPRAPSSASKRMASHRAEELVEGDDAESHAERESPLKSAKIGDRAIQPAATSGWATATPLVDIEREPSEAKIGSSKVGVDHCADLVRVHLEEKKKKAEAISDKAHAKIKGSKTKAAAEKAFRELEAATSALKAIDGDEAMEPLADAPAGGAAEGVCAAGLGEDDEFAEGAGDEGAAAVLKRPSDAAIVAGLAEDDEIAEETADEGDSVVLKRPAVAAVIAGLAEDDEVAEEADAVVLKRPSAAAVVVVAPPAVLARPAAAPAAVVALKRPAAAPAAVDIPGMPPFSLEPIHWAGGRIYHSAKKNGFRVYRRSSDRVDQMAHYPKGSTLAWQMQDAFRRACQKIIDDPRPAV